MHQLDHALFIIALTITIAGSVLLCAHAYSLMQANRPPAEWQEAG